MELELASVPCVPVPTPRRSTRSQPWYVFPLNGIGAYDICGNGPKVLCGHLFNAEAERVALGQTRGDGEECCISMEPIADACLSFEPNLHVQQLYPEFTGVELCCGHRFSAVCLLWHWCLSPMLCPICRAKYATDGEEPTQCCPGNFPLHACNKLGRRVYEIKKAEDDEQERSDREYIMSGLIQDAMENIVHETIDRVLIDPRSFHVILTLRNEASVDVVRCLQLYRSPDTSHGFVGRMRFIVQHAHLRRFNSVSSTTPTEDRDAHTPHNLAASLVIRDPMNTAHMIEISRLTSVDIEPGLSLNTISTPCVNIQGHLDLELSQNDPDSNVPRVHSLAFNVDTASLLEAVARLFTYEVSYADEQDTAVTTISIGPSDES